ncbi:hypothetical protein N7522_011584 [Penicillium canescens]|nr:hypothetical protein N7522_011584 [Penicillium canescens]
MLGQLTFDPHEFLFNTDSEDEQALAVQLSQDLWKEVDAEKDAMRKMTDFLGWDSDNVALI